MPKTLSSSPKRVLWLEGAEGCNQISVGAWIRVVIPQKANSTVEVVFRHQQL